MKAITITLTCIFGFFSLLNAQDCKRPLSTHIMSVNNTRATLRNDGSLFSEASYLFPQPNFAQQPVSSIYLAGLWFTCKDVNGVIKSKISTFPSSGDYYYAGPLNENGTSYDCVRWDEIFTVNGLNIDQHIKAYKHFLVTGVPIDCKTIPADVLYWPGKGNANFAQKYNWELPDQGLASFWDMNSNGIYDPCKGDYPLVNSNCDKPYHMGYRIPSEINYYIINDRGKLNSNASPNTTVGIEAHVHAYAYSNTNEINNMTFFDYRIINKSDQPLYDSYVSMWLDPDLGCYADDYVGCDPESGLVFVYNQDAEDGFDGSSCAGSTTYGLQIPMTAMAVLNPPLVNKDFAKDGLGNFLYDSEGKRILIKPRAYTSAGDTIIKENLSSFYYIENNPVVNPPKNVLEELRKDQFNFPGDPNNPQDTLTACGLGFPYSTGFSGLMSVGPFIMQPSQSTEFTFAIMSIENVKHPCPSLDRINNSFSIAKSIIEDCNQDNFITGPDAPDIIAIEDDRKIALKLSNSITSNNHNESYQEVIQNFPTSVDNTYNFEGYRLYQVRDKSVRFDQLEDNSYAREIFQSDLQNDVITAYNWDLVSDFSVPGQQNRWVRDLKINGSNDGIVRDFVLTKDAFTNTTLENKREYYFTAVAYAYNNGVPFDENTGEGQKTQYLAGSNNFKIYAFSPSYGPQADNIEVTRLSGEGNPNVNLQVNEKLYTDIFSPTFDGKIKYKNGFSPLLIKVTNKENLRIGNLYQIEVDGDFNSSTLNCKFAENATWTIKDITGDKILAQGINLYDITEYKQDDHGFSIMLHNVPESGENVYEKNGGIDATTEYVNPNGINWFNAVSYGGKLGVNNDSILKSPTLNFVRTHNRDPEAKLSQLGNGSFIPFLSSKFGIDVDFSTYFTPAARDLMSLLNNVTSPTLRTRDLNNVDIVFTSDKSKWSKCVVVETTFDAYTQANLRPIGDAKNFEVRQSPSIDTDGKPLNDGTVGFSYFPGYAVDVETGARLNIFFGENSSLRKENDIDLNDDVQIASDMVFNPSSQLKSLNNGIDVLGGQHYIYVTRQAYDGCTLIGGKLKKGSSLVQRTRAAGAITWTSFPILKEGVEMRSIAQGLIPNDVIVKLRVDNPYGRSRFYDIDKPTTCSSLDDHPVYQFLIQEPISSVSDINVPIYIAHPNPLMVSSGHKTISIPNLPDGTTVLLINTLGEIVHKSISQQGQIDLTKASLSNGMYLIELRNSTKVLQTLKLIVL